MPIEAIRPLAAEDTTRLIEFARACKAAARAVVLYPAGHPAIGATLGRLVHLTAPDGLGAPLRITVLADGLRLDDQLPAKTDAALGEFAALLHDHQIGALVIHPGGDLEAWRQFLLLLGRAPADVRAEGGVARLWTTMAGRHVEIQEIDYAEVLRDHDGSGAAGWAEIIQHCLRGESTSFDEHVRRALLEAGADKAQLLELMAALDGKACDEGQDEHARAAALVRLFDRVVRAVSAEEPGSVDAVLDNVASTLSQLSPDMMVAFLGQSQAVTETPDLVGTLVRHMAEPTIAEFVARHAVAEGTPIERLAQAFQTLVPEDRRERVLSLAREQASGAHPPGGGVFEQLWEGVAKKLLDSYSDEQFVSEQYGRELSRARTTAIDVERVSDDPPERLAAWLGSVSTSEIRRLDLALVNDLLRIERDPDRWATLMRPVVALVEDLLLVGDFEAADALVALLVGERLQGGVHRQAAGSALDALIGGSMLRHAASHLSTIDDETFGRAKAMFLSLGDRLIRPLAEVLTEESRPKARERLSAILLAFGASGRSEVERLKNSPSAAVRRTAVYLLREFGGNEALPDLTGLLQDRDPHVLREAARAMLAIGTELAHTTLADALVASTASQREPLLSALGALREEHPAPVFVHLVQRVDHRGPLADLYLRAVELLGALKDPDGVDALRAALYRGEWWAPRRTAALRNAAAAALTRIGTPEANAVLDEAMASGPRGVRNAARAHATATRRGGR